MKAQIEQYERREIYAKLASTDLSEGELSCLKDCLVASADTWAGLLNEEIACVWGLIPPTLLSEQAYIWLYVTPLVENHEFIFVRNSQIAIAQALKKYPNIYGHTEIGNDRAIRWLKWLGATFGEPKGKAVPFVIRKQ